MTINNIIVLILCLIIIIGTFILSIYTIKRKLLDACFNTWYARKDKDKCTDKQINEIIYAEYDVIYTVFSIFWLVSMVFTVLIMYSIFDLW
jgi:hypothetical protein